MTYYNLPNLNNNIEVSDIIIRFSSNNTNTKSINPSLQKYLSLTKNLISTHLLDWDNIKNIQIHTSLFIRQYPNI